MKEDVLFKTLNMSEIEVRNSGLFKSVIRKGYNVAHTQTDNSHRNGLVIATPDDGGLGISEEHPLCMQNLSLLSCWQNPKTAAMSL